MAGALDALQVASATINRDGKITSCCGRFAAFAGRPTDELLGLQGRELMRPQDLAAAQYLLEQLWRSGESFTFVLHSPTSGRLYESHVSRLTTARDAQALCVLRPFTCKVSPGPDPAMAESMARYVIDMTLQMSDMAAQVTMPVMCDLLLVAARAGLGEAGIDEVIPTAA